MKFDYKRFPNGFVRPIVPIKVLNPRTNQSVNYFALVDSGADMCIFSSEIGELIGLDILGGRKEEVRGVVEGEGRPYYLHQVEVEIGGWSKITTVGFMPELSKNGHGLLGQSGFFDRFSFVKFEHAKGTIELGRDIGAPARNSK